MVSMRGDVTIKDAMANSLNTPAIQTLQKVTAKIGSDAIVDYLKKIGFSQVKYSNYHYPMQLVVMTLQLPLLKWQLHTQC